MREIQKRLLQWYQSQSRQLPWRQTSAPKNPYTIWISEVMLQQTTSQAVIPYYEKFLKRFPDVQALAQAPLEEVLKMWAGLGYYQRARLLHQSAQILAQRGFSKTHRELLELPGFGPYTSRAVSSLAFEESVGLVDGNVIRVLSRLFGLEVSWWTPAGRQIIQAKSDELVQGVSSSQMNQAMMDLGATVCTASSPRCWDCPWAKKCVALLENKVEKLPLSKPKKSREVWVWTPQVQIRSRKIALVQNDYAPFLKGQWILPGKAKRQKTAPKKFAYKHVITHHDIFVVIDSKTTSTSNKKRWLSLDDIRGISPTSLVYKTLLKTHPNLKP